MRLWLFDTEQQGRVKRAGLFTQNPCHVILTWMLIRRRRTPTATVLLVKRKFEEKCITTGLWLCPKSIF